MSKIGIAIKITSFGSGQPIVINGGDWIKRVVDIRNTLKHIPAKDADESKIILFMSFTEDACLITVARPEDGRGGDNVAGWIHIPSNLIISGPEVKSVVSKVKDIISAVELPDDAELKTLFGKEYATKNISARYEASKKDGKFAKRTTVRYSLEELLGENRYQSYYSEYNAVFLVPNAEDVEDAEDISDKKLSVLITLLPPTTIEVQRKLGRFVSLYLSSRQIFNDAILLNKGQTITVIAEREGFEPADFIVTAETDGQECEIPKVAWKKKISQVLFDVKSETGKNLNSIVSIKVNGVDITAKPHSFMETECERADVVIAANGYDTYKSTVRLLGDNQIPIILNRRTEEFKKKIRLKNGSTGEICISGKDIKRYESPIKGYVETDGYLEYMPGNVWLQRLIGFGVAVLLWLIMLFVGWWNSVEFKTSTDFPWIEIESNDAKLDTAQHQLPYSVENTQNEANRDSAIAPQYNPYDDINKAIAYLDSTDKWQKDKMEQYKDLRGLFDVMNDMDTKKLAEEWSVKLKQSSNFEKVSTAAQKNYNNRWNPKQGVHNPKYNKPGDYVINLINYTNWLDRDQTQQPVNNQQGAPTQPSNTPKNKNVVAPQNPQKELDPSKLT